MRDCPLAAAPRELAFFWQQKKARKENCRCFDAADPRLGGCTPLRTPKRRSEGPTAKRTQYYCPFLTPSGLPPLLSRVFPRTPASDNSCSVGAAYMPPATYRSNPFPGNLRTLQRGGLPPSLAPLVHNPFTPSRRGRACPARSLAVTAPLSLASQGGSLPSPRRPEGWPPYVLPVDCCLPAGRRGRRPLQASLQAFRLFVGEGFIPPAPPRH